ncbi:hypothetical protein CDAR_529541 [Caerostris darwini]|uniref:Uncharacterized protein n=1 Tax=Caerostris darwini TaxID=1538125 RepID=A0AAV4SQM3_9ARAC|nr:hypothetical protein CDAR_529541 [Caerostris darwini]
MDFFHDDVLSLVFNIGSVFVWDSIKNLKCPKTSKPDQIIENKPIEQLTLNIDDTNVMLGNVTDDERYLNTVNNTVVINATVATETALLNTDNLILDGTAHIEKNIDSNKNNSLLDMVIDEENIFDILYNTVELNIVASNETITSIGDNKIILDEGIDAKCNINIDNNNVVLDTTVFEETMLNVDNKNVVQEAGPEITTSLISNRKEIILDVVELLGKIEDRNVFSDSTHEPIPQSNIEATPRRDNLQRNRILNQRNGLCILYLENYQDLRQRLKARQLQEKTTSREIGYSIKEKDFASSIWKITKICDSVSKRGNSKKRQPTEK